MQPLAKLTFTELKLLRRGHGQGFGLDAMRQRLLRVAGSLEIESAPGEGTAVNARVPAILAEASE